MGDRAQNLEKTRRQTLLGKVRWRAQPQSLAVHAGAEIHELSRIFFCAKDIWEMHKIMVWMVVANVTMFSLVGGSQDIFTNLSCHKFLHVCVCRQVWEPNSSQNFLGLDLRLWNKGSTKAKGGSRISHYSAQITPTYRPRPPSPSAFPDAEPGSA